MAVQLRLDFQNNPVADEVTAITAVVRPVLEGLLYALKGDVVAEVGGYAGVKLKMLPRLYRPGDGDIGICFEYAVHDAVSRRESTVAERIQDALSTFCHVPGAAMASILFGAEKSGALRLIDTAKGTLTGESRLLVGKQGQPVKLRKHIDNVARAFRRREAQVDLPWSIRGLWKADLFLGFTDTDKWVGTTVKVKRQHLEAAAGLRIGIVPTLEGRSDRIQFDEAKNLVVCPLPHDQAFMEVFYQAWGVVKQFVEADAELPAEHMLPRTPERQVARYLADRREFTVLEVIQALGPLSQPELLRTEVRQAAIVDQREGSGETQSVEAPMPRLTST